MKEYDTGAIRNIVLAGHSATGKTSLTEAMLFAAGAIDRLGRVEDGTTASDFDPDEQKRRISINLSILPVEWKETKINILDTPGFPDFIGEVLCGIQAADTVLIAVDASAGVQVGTETVWEAATAAAKPIAFFVNRIDRENANFAAALASIQSAFGGRCVALQWPIGASDKFAGVIDLLTMKAYMGDKGTEAAIPADLAGVAAEQREKLIEAVAEADDDVMTRYLEGEELSEEEIRRALRKGLATGVVAPVLVGSAARVIGITHLLDEIVAGFPSPLEAPLPVARTPGGEEVRLEPSPSAPLVARVFKTLADPFVGRLTFFRVYAGTLTSNSEVWNASRNKAERFGQLLSVRGKTQEPLTKVVAGDIGAVAKLSEAATGDTLCQKDHPVLLPPIEFPEPVFRLAVMPKTKSDADKVGQALQRLVEEDPTLSVERDQTTGEMILAGRGESHLDVAVEKMQRKFHVAVETRLPTVPYRETITQKARAHYRHKKQTGGAGQFGEVDLEIEPLPRGAGFEFAERIVGGTVPREFWPAVEKGVREQMQQGVIAGYPIVDVRVTLVDGKTHPVDSKAVAFEIAGSQAIKEGVPQAKPVLLEPIMNLEIVVPDSNTGDVISDLNTKRARTLGMTPAGKGRTRIEAQAPLAELQRYATDLRSITQGRGTFKATFSHYEEVPHPIAEKIIEQAKREREAKLAHA
jgi:elongation factor G